MGAAYQHETGTTDHYNAHTHRGTTRHTPANETITETQTHWEQHMSAPAQKKEDGRVKWRINSNVNWNSVPKTHRDSTQHVDRRL